MGQTLTNAVDRTHPNDLRARLDGIRTKPLKARIDPNSVDEKEILPVIRQTMSAVGLSGKAMALAAKVSESEISDALNNRENRRFDAEWLWRQDDLFVVTLLDNIKKARQLTEENARSVRAARIKELIGLLLEVAA